MLELQADDQIAIVPETVEGGFCDEQKHQATVPAKNESKSSREHGVDGLFQQVRGIYRLRILKANCVCVCTKSVIITEAFHCGVGVTIVPASAGDSNVVHIQVAVGSKTEQLDTYFNKLKKKLVGLDVTDVSSNFIVDFTSAKDASGSTIATAPTMSLREVGRPANPGNAQRFSYEIDSSTEYSQDELGRGVFATLFRALMSWILPPAPTIRVTLIEEADGTKKATLWMFQTSHKCWNGALHGHRGRKLVDRVERFDDSLVMLEKGKRWVWLTTPATANEGDRLRVTYIKPLVVLPNQR